MATSPAPRPRFTMDWWSCKGQANWGCLGQETLSPRSGSVHPGWKAAAPAMIGSGAPKWRRMAVSQPQPEAAAACLGQQLGGDVVRRDLGMLHVCALHFAHVAHFTHCMHLMQQPKRPASTMFMSWTSAIPPAHPLTAPHISLHAHQLRQASPNPAAQRHKPHLP